MKIKKDELKDLQDKVSNINQAKLRLGTLETQKIVIAQAIINLQRQLEADGDAYAGGHLVKLVDVG